MANQLEVEWVTPQNPNFFEDLFTEKNDQESYQDTSSEDEHNCISAKGSDSLGIDQLETGLMSLMFQDSFLSIVDDTCDSVASKVKELQDSKNEPTPDDLRSLEHLELEVQDSLTTVNQGFSLLTHMDTRCTNALRSLKYNQSVIKDVPNELWTRIFVLAVAPFGAIVHDDRAPLNLSTDNMSLTGTGHCCPETLMLVCGHWYDIAIHTPGLWRNISKAHVAPPSPISSALTDDTIRKLARKPVTKRLLTRLLRHSMSKDRLAHRALAYAERSGDIPLFVDLRCTSFPSVIMDTLRPHFSRINVLYVDRWDRDVIDYLNSFQLLDDDGLQQKTDFLFPELTTLSFTPPSSVKPPPVFDPNRGACVFPRIFKEAPNLVNLKIGFQFDLVSSSFIDVPWSNLAVLEIDRIFDCIDLFWILKECVNLRDAIISCPASAESRERVSTLGLGVIGNITLFNLQSLHYQCETDFDVDLMLLQYLDMPKLRVLSLHADVDPVIGSWLESPRAEELVMRRMFSGAWPLFSTLELLHYNTSDEQELLAIKTSMEQFAASNYPHGTSAGRKIYICGHGVTEEQEDRFHLCVTDGVGDETRLKFAVQRIDNWV